MKIAIAGYGVEGHSSYLYFKDKGFIAVVDERSRLTDLPIDVPTITGEGAFDRLQGYDLVVRTAGLKPSRITTDGKIWSMANEFFAQCPAPIIGVTGSKGKGTTCSLIASILRAGGRTVHLVGNIGVPALDMLSNIQPDDIVVYELSSFQLWDLERSPTMAVVLMVEPDHLDVHDTMDDYVAAKSNIRRHQGPHDSCWYHPTNQYAETIANSSHEGRAAKYNHKGTVDSVYIENDTFWVNEQEICSTDAVVLPGVHNLENACAAITAALPFLDGDTSMVHAGLQSFMGLPHRLKYVREVNGVRYYDDSIATTPGSALAALRSFEQPKIIILGGRWKAVPFDDIVEQCAATNTRIIAIGETRDMVADLAKRHGATCTPMRSDSMDEIVRRTAEMASPGDVVILSPAAASFDMFQNYQDRGDQFIHAVERLGQ